MLYTKPEITPVGAAGQVIQGGTIKHVNLESDGLTPSDASPLVCDE